MLKKRKESYFDCKRIMKFRKNSFSWSDHSATKSKIIHVIWRRRHFLPFFNWTESFIVSVEEATLDWSNTGTFLTLQSSTAFSEF